MQMRSPKLVRLFLLLSLVYLLMPVGGAIAQPRSNWQRLSVAPQTLLERVQKDYAVDSGLEQPIDIRQMYLLQVRHPGARKLFLINTRLAGKGSTANPTCGQAGCLFYGYVESGKKYERVLNGYINDFQVESAPPVIQPIEKVVNKLPCLQLTLYQSQSTQLLSSQLCFDGQEYQPIAPPRVLRQLNQQSLSPG